MNPRHRDLLSSYSKKTIALAIARRTRGDAVSISMNKWGTRSPTWITGKTAVGAMTPGNSADFTHGETAAFLDLVLQGSAVGKLGLRAVPLDARVVSVDTGTTAAFVAAGRGKPISRQTLSAVPLTIKKCSGATVVSDEILSGNSDAAENLIRSDLARACSDALDLKFFSSDAATDAAPAGITEGLSAVSAVASVQESLADLFASYTGDLSRSVWVARPEVYAHMVGVNFPQLGLNGGSLLGLKAVVSRLAPSGSLLLLDPLRIAFGTSGVVITSSNEASIQMDSTPTQDAVADASPGDVAPTNLVALFQ